MPVHRSGNGYRYGHHGKLYHFTPGNKQSEHAAKAKADRQARAIHWSQARHGHGIHGIYKFRFNR